MHFRVGLQAGGSKGLVRIHGDGRARACLQHNSINTVWGDSSTGYSSTVTRSHSETSLSQCPTEVLQQ